ncbi:MAG TPA: Gfo/Idh/MocA family oxidoreductase [Clostridiaceae bacterium]|nr:Gfo/Idh/MocA family oxidoreductase [Clostridiaceae bacterium]
MKSLKVGLIGCGGFARGMHIPILMSNPKYKIHAAMDIIEEAAKAVAVSTKAKYWTTDVDKLLSDEEIDVVFITTRHDSHAELSIKAANAGKHIMCEKPMALNVEDCKAVAEAVKKNNVKYTIGYNRGMAPMIAKARELLNKEVPEKKKMIYHRIQAPFPESHWTHLPEVGGGRFVGEGCHIFDLLCELVQAPPVIVYASGGTFLNPEKVKIPDSAVVTITFADGSVGTTLINSAGCPDFPKEATEIYCDGKAIFINDFTRMEYYGFEGHKKVCIEFDKVDKGHAIELDMLADAIINGTESPNGLVKAARAAVISFKVNESIKTGAPVPISEEDYIW